MWEPSPIPERPFPLHPYMRRNSLRSVIGRRGQAGDDLGRTIHVAVAGAVMTRGRSRMYE